MLSEERQSHFAYILTKKLWSEDLIDYKDDEKAMRVSKKSVREFVEGLSSIDKSVIEKIHSLRRNVPERSSEWEVLYAKYFKEEMIRKGLYW